MLEEHLDNLRAEGVADSEGFFTLNLRSRDRKTLDFYQEQSSFWQCKAIQLAVSLGAAKIDLKCTKRGTTLRATGVQAIEYPFASHSRMSTILRGCLAQPEQVFELGYGGEPAWGLRIDKSGQVEPDESCRPAKGCFEIKSLNEPGGFWESLFKRARRDAGEAHELALRCQHSPIPIRLDGRSLQRARPFGFRPLAVIDVVHTPQLFQSSWKGVARSKATQMFADASAMFQALIGLPDIPAGPSTIYLMREGLLLHAYRVELGFPGTEIVLACPSFKTDATTLQIVVDETFLGVVDTLRKLVERYGKESLRRCRQDKSLAPGSLRGIKHALSRRR